MDPQDTAELTRGGDNGVPALTRVTYLAMGIQAGAAASARRLNVVLDGRRRALIGRGAPAATRLVGAHEIDVRLPGEAVSRLHARLDLLDGRWVIEDCGSKNGTLVNGRAVARSALEDGDVLEIGHTFLVFRAQFAPAAPGPAGGASFSPWMAHADQRLAAMAARELPVIIEGETGTGKELAARAYHDGIGPFVPVDCGALPDALVESELFGAVRGAFSGAERDRLGLIRSAEGGTLFLDEIGELPLAGQAALLRALQERRVRPVGGHTDLPVKFRLCAATNRDLRVQVERGLFRADLFARLNGCEVRLPALRHRREDLGLLVSRLLGRIDPAVAPELRLDADAVRAIYAHTWPHNIRELEHALGHAVAMARDARITLRDLPASVQNAVFPAPADPGSLDDPCARRERLLQLIAAHDGNLSAMSRATGKHRAQLRKWLAVHGIDSAAARRAAQVPPASLSLAPPRSANDPESR